MKLQLNTLTLFFILILPALSTFASEDQEVSQAMNKDSLELLANKSLESILNNQVTEKNDVYLKGEWPQDVQFSGRVVGSGVFPKERTEDPSAFNTAAIANLVISAYPEGFSSAPAEVQESILSAIGSFDDYLDDAGGAYHFFPKIEMQVLRDGVMVKKVVHHQKLLRLKGSFGTDREFHNAGVAPPDIDSTAVIQTTLFKVNKTDLSDHFIKQIEVYRDFNRTPHLLNRLNGYKNTGAFLTWLLPEPKFDEPNLIKRVKKFIDASFSSREKDYRLPLSKNDVDCVVNTNLLRALSLTDRKETPGYEKACQWVNSTIQNGEIRSCGMYYPNTLYLHLNASFAIVDGTKCLESSASRMVEDMLKLQRRDGSWKNDANLEIALRRPDYFQTTLYALVTYINLYKSGNLEMTDEVRESFQKGLKFVLKNIKNEEDGSLSMPEGMFYSGFLPLRNNSAWRSQSYTMGLALNVFTYAHYFIPDVQ